MTDRTPPHSKASLCEVTSSVLVLIDIQTKLANAISSADYTIQRCALLAQTATLLEIPVIVSEQYPKGLGPTDSAIIQHLPKPDTVEKTCFSCSNEAAFMNKLNHLQRPQIILAGMEAHICVLQTALGLLKQKINSQAPQIFIAEDAICSRQDSHKNNAIRRMENAGIICSNSESVIFEWLGDAKHKCFKSISKLIR